MTKNKQTRKKRALSQQGKPRKFATSEIFPIRKQMVATSAALVGATHTDSSAGPRTLALDSSLCPRQDHCCFAIPETLVSLYTRLLGTAVFGSAIVKMLRGAQL